MILLFRFSNTSSFEDVDLTQVTQVLYHYADITDSRVIHPPPPPCVYSPELMLELFPTLLTLNLQVSKSRSSPVRGKLPKPKNPRPTPSSKIKINSNLRSHLISVPLNQPHKHLQNLLHPGCGRGCCPQKTDKAGSKPGCGQSALPRELFRV